MTAEPIAVVGMACRFPGGIDSPESYWEFLKSGRHVVGEISPERWAGYRAAGDGNAAALRQANPLGAYLDDIAGFDAEFFGIAPREAELMDPQQRMTLEVAWEALEHSGIDPQALAGSDTGVFMGVCCDDYGRRLLENLPRLEAWMGIGSSLCGVANRVSYALDLRGPSIVVDTACSASLVAVHQACQSLRAGESTLALAGGVMLVASPSFALVLAAAGATSPDGRSKAFDASADGYGRGEGCGVLVLERLRDARRHGHRVLAVIPGSAVCQDGRTDGIMAPSGAAQEHMVHKACRDAGIDPGTVDYIEAHGTGTALGDPIEIGALSAVVGTGRAADRPCLIGSVKTNIGHLEAASGVAGVMKVVLALTHAEIPPTVIATEPNPAIAWDRSGLRIVDRRTAWPAADRPRRAGIANYGYGGTIAHVLVEEAPAAEPVSEPPVGAGPRLYPLSHASTAGMRATAARLADWLETHDAPLQSVGHTLAHRRAHLDARACVVAADRAQLATRLRQLAAGHDVVGIASARVSRATRGRDAVWVFSGHGAQWVGMGRDLLRREPLLGRALDELTPIVEAELGFSPRQALLSDDLGDVARVQTLIFLVQVGLDRIWRSYGLRPAAVVGHSVGEVAAAVSAGMLDIRDATRLICRRSLLLRRVAGKGRMALVDRSFAEVEARLSGRRDVVAAIAAAPNSTVLSGACAAVEEVLAQWQATAELTVRWIDSDVAFHGPDMKPLLPDLRQALAALMPGEPTLPVYSTALADPRATDARDAEYWAANLGDPVRFAAAIAAAAADGHRLFVEISAHPVVTHSIRETLAHNHIDDAFVACTLRRGQPEQAALLDNLAALYCHGARVDWSVLQPSGELADLPNIAWQHRRYWVDAVSSPGGAASSHDPEEQTLLGSRTVVQGGSPVILWQTRLDFATRPYPGGHAVLGTEVIPAAVVLNTFVAAARTELPVLLTDLELRVPVSLSAPRDLQVVAQDSALRLSSRLVTDRTDHGWLTHATATLGGKPLDRPVDPEMIRRRCDERLDPGAVTTRLRRIGVDGIGFPWRVTELRRGAGCLIARIDTGDTGARRWGSALDAALSVAPMIFPGTPMLRMPGRFRTAWFVDTPDTELVVAVDLVKPTGPQTDSDAPEQVDVDIELLGPDGVRIAFLTGVRFGAVERELGDDLVAEQSPGPADWSELSGVELGDHLADAVRAAVATELRIEPAELDLRRPLAEMGVDSLLATAVRQRLGHRFGVAVPGSVLWDRPTAAALIDYLAETLAPTEVVAE
ncbi:acyltransferase domain-containing protein [Nocardia sp. CDC159]|uniref:Acyltransferase domain-containing protein n=1 Tax=Nocardia pulmonis TaxID=2951408 RepID=A0A9X2E981_9NOCA|nr:MULTISPECIES: type I polyketide synthase [Nocardia]MCM6776622.1 acyltransferase domain-containing protein [Nocardia pulmonis]MCM6789229.1 acyltransferase domain-containing protein [Nocardia sp. CDC159]